MQNAKDTFYEVLRDRVTAVNAALTVVVRGVVRPAVVVDENEVVSTVLRDCFRLRWAAIRIDTSGSAATYAMTCELRYATAGTEAASGLDRGRAIAAMDATLMAALGPGAQSQWTLKKSFAGLAGGGAVVNLGSRIWWSDVVFGVLAESAGELQRMATVDVWSYQEEGEA